MISRPQAHLLYTGYKVLNNSKHLFQLYDESGRFVEAMLVIEHFVVTVMDVIKRGYIFYEIHFAKMEKKERAEAKALFDGKDGFDMQPEWATRKDVYKGEKPNTLYVGLSRARDLAIKDHYLIMRGGTSDPQMNFSLVTPQGTVEKHSSCKYRTLKPQWNEDFVFPQVTPPDEVDIISKFFFGADEDPTEDKDPDLDVEISAEIKFTFRDDFIFYFLTVCVVRSRSCDHSKARLKFFSFFWDFLHFIFYYFDFLVFGFSDFFPQLISFQNKLTYLLT